MPNQAAPNLLSWAIDIEPGTIDQALRAARLRFVEGHVDIGATVGSVTPPRGRSSPRPSVLTSAAAWWPPRPRSPRRTCRMTCPR
jgi:hypothetical protein